MPNGRRFGLEPEVIRGMSVNFSQARGLPLRRRFDQPQRLGDEFFAVKVSWL